MEQPMTVKEILAQRATQQPAGATPAGKPIPTTAAGAAAAGPRVRRAPVVAGVEGYQIEAATAERGPVIRPPRVVSLAEAGFVTPIPRVVPRVTVCTTAGEKLGKTHWALTAPQPIAVISTDTGTREIVERFIRDYDKEIKLCQLTAASALVEAKRGDVGISEWLRVEDAIYSVVEDKSVRTLVIDTATEVWELCRLAYFGKLAQVKPHHYAEPNNRFRVLVKYCYDTRPDLNSVWIHKHKKEYKASGKNDESNWTGKYERSGMADVPFLVDVLAEHYKRLERDEENLSHLFFGLRVLDSRLKPEYVVGTELETEAGMVGGAEQCNFSTLAQTVWPETTSDYWE
jgi:hypothetical protein